MHRGTFGAGTCATAITLFVVHAVAAPRGEAPALVFEATPSLEGCVDEASFRRSVEMKLGHDPFTQTTHRSSVMVVALSRDADLFRARLEVRDHAGTVFSAEPLESGDCAELVSAVVLSVVVALDNADASSAESVTVRAAATPSRTTMEPLQTPLTNPSPARTYLGAGPILQAGAAMGAAPGGMIYLSARRGFFGVAADARAVLPSSVVTAKGSVDIWTASVTGGPCGHLSYFSLCALASLGAVSASSADVPGAHADGTFVAGFGGRFGGGLPIGDTVELRLQLDAIGTATARPRVAVEGTPVYRLPLVAVGGAALVGFRL